MKRILSISAAISLTIFFACEKKTEPVDLEKYGLEYYPVEIGKYWEYSVDSLLYGPVGHTGVDSTTSYLREEIVDTFRNDKNELVYRLDVFARSSDTLGWDLINSSFIRKDNSSLIKTENGLHFIKLTFPVTRYSNWNGNVLIHWKSAIVIKGEEIAAFDNWNYIYESLSDKIDIGPKHWDDVLTVNEADYTAFDNKRYSVAQYVKNVGPVYREQWFLDTQIYDERLTWREKAQKGMILRMKLIQHN